MRGRVPRRMLKTKREFTMTADEELFDRVRHRLDRQPEIDPKAIAVSVHDGRVTLRGTVGSLQERQSARDAAERAFGVVSVDDELEVRQMNAQDRDDSDIRADVLEALMREPLVPDTIDASVDTGLVTLTGTARWQYERDAADHAASGVAGVLGIADAIDLERPMSSEALSDR
jgi:osmotically-inducible protein OsmY